MGKVPAFEGNLTTEVGSYLEEFVAKLFERETGKKVRRKNCTVFNDDFPWAHANVDRVVVGENAVLEIKTTNSFENMKLMEKNDFPAAWYCQVMHYMTVCGFEKAYIAVLIGGREFKWFEVEFDADESRTLMELEATFWKHLEDNTPPPVSGMDCDTDTLNTVYAESAAGSVELFGHDSLLDEYFELGEKIAVLKQQQEVIKQHVCADMGEYDTGLGSRWKVSWKTQQRQTFDHKKFATDHPDVDLSRYYKVSTSRPFKIK
jgi:putative phage-type endonuclease